MGNYNAFFAALVFNAEHRGDECQAVVPSKDISFEGGEGLATLAVMTLALSIFHCGICCRE